MLKPATNQAPLAPANRRRRQWPHRVVVAALILGGVLVTVWPAGQTLLGNRVGSIAVIDYTQQIEQTQQVEPGALSAELEAAQAYNEALQPEALYDPWGTGTQATDANHDVYRTQLALTDVMARIRIPQIEVDLPVYHDATDASLAQGAGHMYGTSLPVGGAGTHAVIAAHTDYVGRTFFDRLPELQVGQTFQIDVVGSTLTYQIDQLSVVQPAELAAVEPIDGADHVTLVTCLNGLDGTDRLLVRGVRVPDAAAPAGEGTTTTTSETTTVPVSYDSSVQGWMWPRIIAGAVGVLLLAGMALSWVAGDRRSQGAKR